MRVETTEKPDTSKAFDGLTPALVEAAQALIAQIQRRASRGVGVDDSQMPSYSKTYAAIRQKRGRDPRVRNLTMSGSMLRSLHLVSVNQDRSQIVIEIGFANAQDYKKALWNQRVSPWFGASPADRKIIVKLLQERIGQAVQESKK